MRNDHTYYISGPMTGIDWHNKPLFAEIADEVRRYLNPLEIVVPHELIGFDPELTWQDYMRADIRGLLGCTAMIMLPGWTESRGALLEFSTGVGLGLEIFFVTHSMPRMYVEMKTGRITILSMSDCSALLQQVQVRPSHSCSLVHLPARS